MTTDLMIRQNHAVSVYDKVADPAVFMRETGLMFAKSGMFGCANEQQGGVLALACLCEGKTPTELMRVYHIINAKLSMRADAMLAEYRKLGGKVKWITDFDNETECKGEWTHEGVSYIIGFTFEQAKKAGYVKKGSNWEKTPAEMLRARTISRAVRGITPEVVAGYYTPEEIADEDGGKPAAKEVKSKSADQVQDLMGKALARGKAAIAANPEGPADSDVIDAEVVDSPANGDHHANGAAGQVAAANAAGSVAGVDSTSTTTAAATTPTAAPGGVNGTKVTATKEQLGPSLELVKKHQIPPTVLQPYLTKFGAASFREITSEQAAELFAGLKAAFEPAANSHSESAEFCTAAQREEIVSLYVDLKVPVEVQNAILKKRDASTLRNLTPTQATEIIHNLQQKQLAARLEKPNSPANAAALESAKK